MTDLFTMVPGVIISVIIIINTCKVMYIWIRPHSGTHNALQ